MLFLLLLISPSIINGITLRQHLFNNYSYEDIPESNISIGLGLAIRSLNNVDHMDGTLETNVWLRHYWQDKRLSWNPMDFNNQTSIVLYTDPETENLIWTPDIYLYNTAELPMSGMAYSRAIVSHMGEILWSRPGILKSTCIFNLHMFPYDKQDCYLKFGSWGYNGNEFRLNIVEEIDLENYQKGEEWTIIETSEDLEVKIYDCCPEPYYSVYFNIKIERLADYYVSNIIIPIFATSSLLVISMLIPWESGERISFTTTVMLSIVVFLLILSDNLPKSNDVPLITSMVSGLMFFSLGVVFITVLISSMRSMNKEDSIFAIAIAKCFGKWFCKSTDDVVVNIENEEDLSRSNSYSEAITPFIENFEVECKKLALYVEHGATLIFFVAFVSYCTVTMVLVQ
jgi:hypothetical protein